MASSEQSEISELTDIPEFWALDLEHESEGSSTILLEFKDSGTLQYFNIGSLL